MDRTGNFVLRMSPGLARGLSLAMLASVMLGYGGEALLPDASRPLAMGMSALKITGLLLAIALFLSTWGQQAMAKDHLIDERQQRERDRAFTISHRFMVFTAIFAFFYVDLSAKLGLPLPERTRDAADLINVYVLLSLSLPGIILAWQAPVVEDDE